MHTHWIWPAKHGVHEGCCRCYGHSMHTCRPGQLRCQVHTLGKAHTGHSRYPWCKGHRPTGCRVEWPPCVEQVCRSQLTIEVEQDPQTEQIPGRGAYFGWNRSVDVLLMHVSPQWWWPWGMVHVTCPWGTHKCQDSPRPPSGRGKGRAAVTGMTPGQK